MTRSGSWAQATGALVLACTLGCGAGDVPADGGTVDPDLVPVVCDGSEDLRLFITSVAPSDRVGPTQRLLYENGFYVQVDGRCRFWANNIDIDWAEVRTGTLDTEAAASLLTELRYSRWSHLEGVYPPAPGVFDVGTVAFMDAAVRVVCVGNCGADVVPDEVKAMRDAFGPWAQRLWQSGTAADGDIRMEVFQSGLFGEPYDLIQASAWPFASMDLHALAVPYEDAESVVYGDGIRLAGADADVMRRLRREYMAGEHGPWWYGFIPIRDEAGTLYEVYVRDSSPFENDRGLIDWLHSR